MSNTRIYWLHTLSPTHAGTGRGVGYIDLPIDRDGVTGWPILRGSGFKGVWADYYAVKMIPEPEQEEVDGKRRAKDRRKMDTPAGRLLKAAFGMAGENNESNSGALIPTDAKLICLPVRSFRGTYAWATSPLCLQMLRRTLELAGFKELPEAPKELPDDKAHHATGTALVEGKHVYLEDLDFMAVECKTATAWAAKIGEWVFGRDDPWAKELQKRFVVLPDNAFDFLCETGTEVHTRVRIDDDTKTVADKALWTEESLPAETILMGLIQCDRVFGRNGEDITPQGLLKYFATDALTLQIGGKATIGRGQVRCVFTEVK
jgi:CRISPR-associated protein Cmr4